MQKRAAIIVTIMAAISAAQTVHAQSVDDLSGSRAIVYIGASDMARARQYYGQVLGLRIIASDPAGIVADAGGVRVRITHPPQVVPAPYTVLGFEVNDIPTITRSLEARGVKFLKVPELAKAQDAHGIWTSPNGDRVAWFKDPDGNMLSVSDGGSGR
jgi:catechol 2,3-dioxygenase-like lactoylglutathione lyase family enzyme